MTAAGVWTVVCDVDALPRACGVAALIAGEQVAIFRTEDDEYFATSNRDPFTDANVLSRGVVGSRAGVAIVSSPMLKHAFNLATGQSFDDPEVVLATYAVSTADGVIAVGAKC